MNGPLKNFIFLSELIGIPVVDAATGTRIGRIVDFVAGLKEMYPRISGLMMRERAGNKCVFVAWRFVAQVKPGESLSVNVTPETFQPEFQISIAEILIKEMFWDKQIVDVQGSKVVRVNDLHLLIEGLNLWVVHVDVGITGLLRRLGSLGVINYFVKLTTSCELKDRFISWKFVQPVTHNVGTDSLSLKISHSQLTELAPGDMADILVELGTDERVAILKSVDAVTAANSLQALPLKIQLQIVEVMDPKDLLNILNEMAVAEVANMLSELPKKRVNSMLGKLTPEKTAQISHLLDQSSRSVQRIMRLGYVFTRPDVTVAMVLDMIRTERRKRDFTPYVYVLGEGNVLVGVISIHQLLTTPPEKMVSDVMRKRLIKVNADATVRVVAEVFYKYDFTVVPVVDRQNHMQGIVTMKEALACVFPEIQEEVTR